MGKKKARANEGLEIYLFLTRNENFVEQKRKHPCTPGM